MAQPMAMPGMVYPGQQPQPQYYAQPGQIPPGPPPHVTGMPAQFGNGAQPGPYMQPMAPGPAQFPGQAPCPPAPAQYPPGAFPHYGPAPDIMGIGKTRDQFAMEQANAALANEANEPQDFEPADKNPGRMYWTRQLDGEWIQMTRATIDNLPTRWYVWPSGVFYAIRLED